MKSTPRTLAFAALCSLIVSATAVAGPLVLGDSGVAVRLGADAIDVDTTVQCLSDMACNTYLYDLPHGTDAWEKLPAFLDTAAARNIGVYVMLEPWTLARRGNEDQSNQPYGTDYVKWCEEIGALADSHPNLLGVVMDDFASNSHQPDRFSPELLAKMLDALHDRGPRLKFQPILYFNDPWDELIERFGPQFGDGVIVCYPRSRGEVGNLIPYLVDGDRGAALDVELPRRHHLRPGEGTFAEAIIDRTLSSKASILAFYFDDQNATTKRGRHRVVVTCNGKVIWSRELAGESQDAEVSVRLPSMSAVSRVSIGVISDEPSEEASVRVRLQNIRFESEKGKPLPHQPNWNHQADEGIRFEIAQATQGQHRWKIPMTLMVAAAPFEVKKRFNEPGDAEHIKRRLADAVAWARDGLADGVITFWAPKDAQSEIAGVVGEVFSASK